MRARRPTFRVTIRDDNHRVESTRIRRLREEDLHDPSRPRPPGAASRNYGWDLAGLTPAVEKDKAVRSRPCRPSPTWSGRVSRSTRWRSGRTTRCTSSAAIRAGRPVGRSWTSSTCASPPHRMFAAVYPAKDKRHVVLMQAHTFNANLGPLARSGKLLYTSPAGVKVWSSKDDKAMAKILLSSIGSTRPSSPIRRPRIASATCWRRPTGPSRPSRSTGP